jgi:GAF domain-containing protein
VINPRDHFAGEDVAFLDALAADIAISCERARLYDQLRRETVSLRKVCRNAGLGLAALGVVFVTGALYAHLARALPLAEEDSRRRR